jgi:hypothetical protein
MRLCLEEVQSKLQRVLRLLGESEQQIDAATSRAVRRDAARAVEALEAKLQDLVTDASACLKASDGRAGARSAAGNADVVYVDPAPDPAAEAVSEPGSATEVIDRDRALSTNVRVVRGELVDGHGEVSASAVRSAVDSIGHHLERCYAGLVEHGALARGTAILVFRITSSGRVRGVRTEQVRIGDAGFERCLRRAGRQLRIEAAARGGEAVYSYTLKFGP